MCGELHAHTMVNHANWKSQIHKCGIYSLTCWAKPQNKVFRKCNGIMGCGFPTLASDAFVISVSKYYQSFLILGDK